MKRTLKQAVIFSTVMVVLYYAAVIGWSYYTTRQYVPDIVNAYESVDHMQQKVAFGVVGRPLDSLVLVLLQLAGGMFVFIAGKLLVLKLRSRR
ncbi:hypothetical protein [Paenibacillus sp. YYML68]|uniref:hypothetical protein n=1 Tax=Paenibacillus sp. YYML68 TaxID=2909250 RepID=UPI002493AF60|nr:hypothetical protein [Paenibacillus sp. YYML68]